MATLRVPLRAAAVSLAASGLIVAALLPLHPSIFDRPIGEVVADTPLWTAIHFAGIVAFPLAVIGAAGIVAAHGERMGRLGRIGLLATLIGAFGGMALAALETLAFPVLAERSPELLAIDGPLVASWQFVVFGLLALAWPVGLALIGLSAMRAGRYPRPAGLLLAIGGPAFLLLAGPFVPVAGVLASLLFGGVQVWWGVLLWRTERRRN
ncbi:hypothetical protein ACFFGH_28275 [Lysobacter korlensis]|uniref:DUF4386 family protein n=1 Tax=Lysobacter korlensis TaxID=553636 RepID=A0ABV6RXP9_9GAMM